jgi:hypothetical protein
METVQDVRSSTLDCGEVDPSHACPLHIGPHEVMCKSNKARYYISCEHGVKLARNDHLGLVYVTSNFGRMHGVLNVGKKITNCTV